MNLLPTLRSALAAARRKPDPKPGETPIAPRGQISSAPRATAPAAQPLAMASLIRPQVRERWLLPQIAAITPQYIEMTLRGALAGAHVPQWELFNLMEDTWPRLRKNVLELKTAVRNRRPIFEAYREEDEPESPTATERMKLISAAVRKMKPDARADESAYDDMVNDILDAWFKGVSVLEIDWQMTQTPRLGRFLAPRCTRWVSPVSYAWSADLRLCLSNYEQNTLGEIPDDKFLIARCKTKSGTILGGALLRPLVWWWCAANFSADWLLNLAQVFGLPFRWANYDPTAAPETVDRISSMLQNMGSAGWAAFPTGTTLELRTEGMKAGNQTPQGDMLDRADKQCDLLVLGQTLTTDTGGMGAGGGSHALGQVHQDVRGNVIDAAAKFVSGVLEQQLIPSILRLNFGNDDEAPTLTLAKDEQDDLTAKSAIIAQLKTAGAGAIIPLDWLGKTFGIPKPAEGEATLADALPGPTAPAPNRTVLSPSKDIPHPTSNAQPPIGDFVAASDHWNPDLHPRDQIGRFARTDGSPTHTSHMPADGHSYHPLERTGTRRLTQAGGSPPIASPSPVASVATDANPQGYSDDQKKRLTEAAQHYMENAYLHHPNEMGSENPGIRTSAKKRVHCTTYCVDAIAAGYKAIGMPKTAQKIASMRDDSSVFIAKYLRDTLGWGIVYFNPDTQNPSYGGEHAVTNRDVNTKGTYYKVRVDGKMVNYDPQLGGAVHTRTEQSPNDKAAHDKMYQIPFGMISAMGGIHSALFSRGDVYQIHYDQESSETGTPETDTLYEKGSFLEFTREHWRSGIIAVLPGQDIPRKAP